MARKTRSETVFFRYDGAERKDVYLRINPIAVRYQQGSKGGVTDTLGGYFRETFSSKDPQYSGLLLPDLTLECSTGIAYRNELKKIEWIWAHHGDRKPDGSPVDLYFFDFNEVGPYQDVTRDAPMAYLIELLNFAWDESVNSPYEIKFSMRCKILRSVFAELDNPSPQDFNAIPSLADLIQSGLSRITSALLQL
ncbi:MAG: hypothetical protein LRZ84_14480 [Desertifilum sp.]|nr:hypothetical protein [Desertifilum sp.]